MPNPERFDDPLWTTTNPPFSVVRKVVIRDVYAAQIDDLNGDYREMSLTLFRRGASEWEEIISIDDVGYPPGVGKTLSSGYDTTYAWAVGRDRPDGRIIVHVGDRRYPVQADAEGWWIFVRHAQPPVATHTYFEPYVWWSRD